MKTSDIDLSFLNTYLDPFENILFAFINNQNLPLCFAYKANNKLTKLLNDYTDLLGALINSLNYINNLERTPGSSTDVQASILLTKGNSPSQLKDKLFTYVSSFQDFKTPSVQEIKESSIDSSETIYSALNYLEQVNTQIIELVTNIGAFPPQLDFEDLRLTLLDKLLETVKQTDSAGTKQSPISTLINLISSFAFYDSLIGTYNVYSPIVSKTIPKDLKVYAAQEKNRATSLSLPFPQPTTNTNFIANIDGTTFTIPFPSSASAGRQYMLGSGTTFNVPANTRLYFKFNSSPLPHGRFVVPEGIPVDDGIIPIDIPAGTISLATLISTLNAGFNTFDMTFTMRQFATADYLSIGSNRLIIYGNTFVSSFSTISPPGYYNTATLVYKSTLPSCNTEVNLPIQNSKDPFIPNYRDLVDCINYYTPNIVTEEDRIRVTSSKDGSSAIVAFATSIATDIGLTDSNASATQVFLLSEGKKLNPIDLNLASGYVIKDPNGEHTISVGDALTYTNIPNLDKFDVEIFPDLVSIVKRIILNTKFVNKHKEIVNLVRPLVNNPTIGQLNEAKTKLPELKRYYETVVSNLISIAVPSPLINTANDLLTYLEQKGYTKLVDMLNKADLNNFFSAVKEKKNLSFNQALADAITTASNS